MTGMLETTSIALVPLLVGIAIGGYLFFDTQPRSILALDRCQSCLEVRDLEGLLASVGIQIAPGMLPGIVEETTHTIVIRHPDPVSDSRYHVVLIPKRDIKHVGTLASEDVPSLIDIFAVAARLVESSELTGYRIWSTGLEAQGLTYLHFHLAGR